MEVAGLLPKQVLAFREGADTGSRGHESAFRQPFVQGRLTVVIEEIGNVVLDKFSGHSILASDLVRWKCAYERNRLGLGGRGGGSNSE